MKISNAFAAALLLAGCTGLSHQIPTAANAPEISVNAAAFSLKTFIPGKTPGFPSGAVAEDLIAGPDGTIWFIDSGNGDVGRITPAGAITEFSNPRLATFSGVGIAVSGHDVWAVELGPPPSSALARVSMRGKVTVVALPKGLSADGAIAADNAGNLWITALNDRNIVHVERLAAGKFETFPTGFVAGGEPCCPNEALKRLVVGPDGRPWFTTLYYSSTTGPANAVVTLAASGIATDGTSLWVSGGDVFQVNGAIYHVTTDGKHSAHAVDNVPIDIAVANGELWLTNYYPTVGGSISEVTSDT